jgi:hypothetical protein
MNGFDQFASSDASSGMGASGAKRLDPSFPEDFTCDEERFASKLRDLYDIEREDLPPGYVPTLLGYERHKPAMPGFERRLTMSVFRELELQRPLFERSLVLQIGAALAEPVERVRHAGRSAVGVLASAMLVMVLSMVFASPSFADGLNILLGHTGVQQVAAYPRNVRNPEPQRQVATQDIQTPLYWMGPTVAGDYAYLGMRALPSEGWSQGPIVDIQYVLTHASKGTGVLDVRMFQVANQYQSVMKAVQDGSAHETRVAGARAAFVNGAWKTFGRSRTWSTSARNELIFEKDGVVFWMASDPRDGLTESQMIAAASQMRLATRHDLAPSKLSVGSVGHELQSLLRSPGGEDLYAVILRGDSDAGARDLIQFQTASAHQFDTN